MYITFFFLILPFLRMIRVIMKFVKTCQIIAQV